MATVGVGTIVVPMVQAVVSRVVRRETTKFDGPAPDAVGLTVFASGVVLAFLIGSAALVVAEIAAIVADRFGSCRTEPGGVGLGVRAHAWPGVLPRFRSGIRI